MTASTLLLSGVIFPDINHERLFLRVRHGMRVQFDGGAIEGDRVLRLVDNLDPTQAALPSDLFEHRAGAEFSMLAHIATPEERANHDDVTEPTLTVDRLVPFEAVQLRAYDIWERGRGGSAMNDWLLAELELLLRGAALERAAGVRS